MSSLVAGPSDPTRLAGEQPGKRNTMRMEAGSERMPVMAPAFRPPTADEARSLHKRGKAKIAITPRWGRVVIGAAMAIAGLALLVGYLPSAGLESELRVAGNIAAGALLGFGLLIGALGAVFRAEAETRCRSCERTVFGVRSSFGLRCPACHAYARINWLSVAFTVIFWLTTISMVITLAVLILT
jgi:hypothetical protein